MLPELTEFVPAIRMGIVRKVLLGLENRAGCILSTSSQCFWTALTFQNLKLDRNLEVSWYSCNILRYCSNRCIVWFFIPENCSALANRKFPVQLYVKIQILFEPPFWICKWANHLSFLAMLCCLLLKFSTFWLPLWYKKLLAISLSVIGFTASDYPFGIFKCFLYIYSLC